ncbi:hypothetical protein BC833DRAFT_661761 [Globomyces pollinis-pini]|nr:hypothetical protein BC833DRAFT_661761 [Globomyces pollinis-pini]
MFSAVVLALVSSSIAAPAYGYDKAAPAYVTPTTTPCAETTAPIATPAYNQVAPIATAPYNTAAPIVATTPCETPNVYATAAPIATPGYNTAAPIVATTPCAEATPAGYAHAAATLAADAYGYQAPVATPGYAEATQAASSYSVVSGASSSTFIGSAMMAIAFFAL